MIALSAAIVALIGLTMVGGQSVASPVGGLDPCQKKYEISCGSGGNSVFVGGDEFSKPTAPGRQSVVSRRGPVERWLDCGVRIVGRHHNALDLGPCFEPLWLCALTGRVRSDPNVHVFVVVTTFPDGTTSSRHECAVDVRGARRVRPVDVRAWLVKRIPTGGIGTTGARTLVNVDAVLWLVVRARYEWGPVTVVQPDVRIRVRLDHVRWDFGDGVSDDAPGVGRPYDAADPCGIECPQYYGHAYTTRKGPMTLRATGYWKAEFSVGGGAWQGLPQLVPAAPAPNRQLTVVEARSELVSN